MTTFNTGNPVPSTDSRDLSDNAENFDSAVNTNEATWQDRLGAVRDTVQGKLNKLGIIYDDPIKDWTPSLLVNDLRAHRYPAITGDVYVPVKPLPFTTGATFNTNDWVLNSAYQDVAVEQQLINDLSQDITLSVAEYKAFTSKIPLGKSVVLSDRDKAKFTVVETASGTVDGFGFIQSTVFPLKSIQIDRSGELNVLHFGLKADSTNGTDGTDNTLALQAARDSKRPLYFPSKWSGGYRITNTVTGHKNDPAWRGDGWRADLPKSGTVIYLNGSLVATETTNAQGKMLITGTPYISPSPLYLKNLTIDGLDKTGIGVELGVNAEFFGFGEWDSVQIRGCGLAVNTNNLFITAWDNIVIRNNKRGVQIQPTDNVGPDDGYFTTWSWSNCYIAFNDGFGVSINTPLGNKNFSWRNTSVESNCQTLDKTEGQISAYNARINTYSCYFERTSDTPYYYAYGGVNWLEHEDPHVQETSGVKQAAGAFVYRHRGGQMVSATDKAFDINTNNMQSFFFERANIDETHSLYADYDGTYKLSGFDTFGADGLFTMNGVKADTFISGASADKATTLRRTRVYRKDLTGITINSGARISLIQDYGDASTSVTTTADCKIYGLNPGGAVANIFLQYSQGTTNSDSIWSVQAFNHGGANYDLTGAYLLVSQHYWESSEIIDI